MLEIVMQNYLKDKKLPKKARTSRKIIKAVLTFFKKGNCRSFIAEKTKESQELDLLPLPKYLKQLLMKTTKAK